MEYLNIPNTWINIKKLEFGNKYKFENDTIYISFYNNKFELDESNLLKISLNMIQHLEKEKKFTIVHSSDMHINGKKGFGLYYHGHKNGEMIEESGNKITILFYLFKSILYYITLIYSDNYEIEREIINNLKAL